MIDFYDRLKAVCGPTSKGSMPVYSADGEMLRYPNSICAHYSRWNTFKSF